MISSVVSEPRNLGCRRRRYSRLHSGNKIFIHRSLQRVWTDWLYWVPKINKAKCVAVRFTRRRNMLQDSIRKDAWILSWSPHIKYLDMHLDQRLTCPDVEVTKTMFIEARNVLIPLLVQRNPLGIRSKTLIYTTMLGPILIHGILEDRLAPVLTPAKMRTGQ